MARRCPGGRRMVPVAAVVLGGVAACTVAGPAVAFDCAAASAPVEHAICSDPVAKAADDAMGAAYDALRAVLGDEDREALRQSQRAWLGWREAACLAYDPEEARSDRYDTACLVEMTEARRALLAAEPETAGPGAPDFVPHFLWRAGTPVTFEIDIQYPQAVAGTGVVPARVIDWLNAALEEAVMEEAAWAFAPPEPDAQPSIGQMYHGTSFRIVRADETLISVVFAIDAYSGGAHPNHWSRAVNLLLTEGRSLAVADLFDAAGQLALRKLCRAQIAAEKRERGLEEAWIAADLTDEALDAVLLDPAHWAVGRDLTIVFDPYAIGSYAEGGYQCTIEPAVLGRIGRPDGPVAF